MMPENSGPENEMELIMYAIEYIKGMLFYYT